MLVLIDIFSLWSSYLVQWLLTDINVAAIAMFELAGFSRELLNNQSKVDENKKMTYRMLYPDFSCIRRTK